MFSFEIKDRDAGGRICNLIIKENKLETPIFLPVYNPNIPLITPEEMIKEFNVKALMSNAYIIYKNEELRKETLSKGIHEVLNFNGTIFCDSGAYQMFRGEIKISQKEIIEFQEKIGTDVGVMLDVPSKNESYEETKRSVLETIERAKEWEKIKSSKNVFWEGVIQGGGFRDLVEYSCRRMREFNFDIFAVGVPPLLWKNYEFKSITLQGLTTKINIPSNKPLHAFGIGHPIIFCFLVAIGYDIFDSASYAIYARDLRYITEYGTKKIDKLEFLPCNCPICSKYTIKEIKEMEKNDKIKIIAKHNLYTILKEINIIKQAIKENSLWELCQIRARNHPKLIETLFFLLKDNYDFFEKIEPIRKRKPIFYIGEESIYRPEIIRAKNRIKSEIIPSALNETYPFQIIFPTNFEIFKFDGKKYSDLEKIRIIADYQFDKGIGEKIFSDKVEIEKSKNGRIKRIWNENKLLATIRARDGFLALRIEGARLLHKYTNPLKYRVVISDEEIKKIVSEGKNVFAKFIEKCDINIIPKEEVLIVDENDNLLAVGEAILTGREMMVFKRGVAVKVRDSINRNK
ncbi:MAG: tRNA guanosine(15) transglycosylase TgtA [Nitrososphaerota archaeon]